MGADLRVVVGAGLRVVVGADLRVVVGADLRVVVGADPYRAGFAAVTPHPALRATFPYAGKAYCSSTTYLLAGM